MRHRGMGAESIEVALLVENEKCCEPPLAEAEVKRIAASVSRYEPAAPVADINGDCAPVAAVERPEIYAGDDDRINAGVPDLEAAFQQQEKDYRFITYPGADHAFFNDTGRRYHPQAAGEAWQEALGFFDEHLKS